MENQKKTKTFGGFAGCYVDAVLRKGSGYQRIDVFFDHYRRHAIKATTRRQRSKNTARPVRRVIEGREVPLPMKWQAFLALGDNKTHGLHLSCKHLLPLHGSIWPLFKRRGCSRPFGDPTTKKKIRGLFFMKSDKSTTL